MRKDEDNDKEHELSFLWVLVRNIFVALALLSSREHASHRTETLPAALWVLAAPMRVLAPAPTSDPVDTGPAPEGREPVAEQSAGAGRATHYGESYQGQPLGCGTGVYDTADPGIVAVSPYQYDAWPCGTVLRVCGDHGCIVAARQDSCPGCTDRKVDLSEAGFAAICGDPQRGVCSVTIEEVE